MMLLKRLSTNDLVTVFKDCIKIEFVGKRNVLSTCAYNGGYQENLNRVFNYDSSHNKTVHSEMKAPTLKEHMKIIAEEIGLETESSAGMCTAAQMKNVAIKELEHQGVTVTAIVTGGIEVNGGRAGDPASWYEKGGRIKSIQLVSGTINIMLVIDAMITEEVLASALMTATEAKVVAVQELLLPSKYSRGIATGSGTDKMIIIGNPSSKIKLTDAGKHSKLGELIGKSVILAVKEALDKQTNANPKTQHSVIKRMERYGVTKERLHILLSRKKEYNDFTYLYWENLIENADKNSKLVVTASIYAHLLDELEWGLLSEKEVRKASEMILTNLSSIDYVSNRENNEDSENNEENKNIVEINEIIENKTDKSQYLIWKFEDIFVSYIFQNI